MIRAALVSDALDALGLRNQCLPAAIVPLVPGTIAAGRAAPLETVLVDDPPPVPYQGLLQALDSLDEGEVVVVSSLGREDVALWGELLSTLARARGGAGAVCDGNVRDAAQVRALGFPVFARGTFPTDVNGRLEVTGRAQTIVVGGVTVSAGDLVVADDDGVVVAPAAVADEVVARAREKASGESEFRTAVEGGVSATEAFRRLGVL